ncbi:IS3 family transposase [uncultured Bacteroides sp.]|uniref:IS3 family transposase n=1 Tax=uncultured Bacteroides sp. TaxID=162156 RepID=UPI002AAAF352|nr:IS3 family transposase [uncultured Bacteroides sp.]
MIYQFIRSNDKIWPIEVMCNVLKVSRSGYYRWIKGSQSRRAVKRKSICKEIQIEYFQAKCRYGSIRITKELNKRNVKISRTTVAHYMKEMGIQSKLSKKYKITTDSNHSEPVANNILNRSFEMDVPSKAWVSDITYIPVVGGFLYLTSVIDLFDRKIIGWSVSENMASESTVIPAFNKAVSNRKPQTQMIFHSDRGSQYASKAMVSMLKSYGIRQSMSRKGNCWDNAVAESFFKTLKAELIYGSKILSKEKMKTQLFEFIEIWYNRRRRHSALKNLTIEEYWNEYIQKFNKLSNVA